MEFQITRAKDTVCEMMTDRGFFPSHRLEDPTDSSSKEPVLWEFAKEDKIALVLWGLSVESKVVFAQRVLEEAKKREPQQIVLIVDKPLVSKAKTAISNIRKITNINVFELADVQFSKPRHKLVPKHRLVSAEERKAVLESYQVEEKDLPRISCSDPIVQWYGWCPGDIIEILRKEGIFQMHKTHRIVWPQEILNE
ncbi:DNA-directed RNA polymerase subunit RPB5 [Golden Marseillevirus]|uniref:DNA-directed RNA polymerase subunit RPB5 n=1 Tax=Golden Marseillevirus TaxID=1720526 RepID=UPI000877A8DA|nr:DNA-directed RNA polymerase subunit RPB5 [Golden Marseillevirus]ALX27625.1 DNA-directed RNA polymerase subunit RPB5 [Golden Marseillevirus]